MLPHEFDDALLRLPEEVVTVDMEGEPVGRGVLIAVRNSEDQDKRRLLMVEVPWKDRLEVAGFRIQEPEAPLQGRLAEEGDPIVCRCERVRKSEIVRQIQVGTRDLNELKALSRASMGGCGGKTCTELVMRIFREQGVDLSEVTPEPSGPLWPRCPWACTPR